MSDEPTRIHDAPSSQAAAYKASGDPEALVGQLLKGAYRIEGKIGEGGMGVVFRATQLNLGRPVAVKMIHVASKVPASGVDRFFREARLLSQLHHPNIVHILDFGTEAGPLHFMVMEYLSGEPLDRYVESRSRLSPDLVLDLMEQICAGMSAAHGANVIHRDLKPSNLFIVNVTGSVRPVVKILDFGLGKELVEDEKKGANITREGVMMGTTGYSAPEQLHGGSADELADVYSLGALLYFLVAGRPPYRDEGFRTTLIKQLTDPPAPLEPDPQWSHLEKVEAVIHKAMSVRPNDRYRSPTALFMALLEAVRPGETVEESYKTAAEGRRSSRSRIIEPPTAPCDGHPTGRRRTTWPYLAAAMVLVLLLGSFLWLKFGRDPEPEPLKFGLSAPFDGPTKELGRGIKLGIETRFAAQNEMGGVHGRKLVLIERDDGYEPERAVENMRKLIDEDKVFGFIGNVGSPTSRKAMPIAVDHQKLFFAPYSGARFLRGDPPNRYVFNYRAAYDDETAAIVVYLTDVRRVKPEEIAVFAQNDEFGDDGFEGVARALKKKGRKHNEIRRVGYKRNTTDVKEAVEAIAKAGASIKAVIMVATYQPATEFIKQMRDRGLDTICTNISFVGSDSLSAELRKWGPRYVKGVIVTQVVPPLDSGATGVVRFRNDLKRFSRTEPASFVALEGYVAASILIDALQRTGPNPDTERLIDELEKTRGLDLGIGPLLEFGPSRHQATKKVWAIEFDETGGYRELDLDD